jgi:hypothetical protein
MAKFERISLDPVEWGKTLAAFPDGLVYQTPQWLAFVAETQKGEPVLAVLKEGNETLGYFTGVLVQIFGLKILGSPFRKWTTPYMGFCMKPGVPRRVAVEALPEFAFKELGAIHFEVVDPHMTVEDIAVPGINHELNRTCELDLTQSEETLLANMNSYRRRDIRRAEKDGVAIQEADDEEFAGEYAEQLTDVFEKQNLVPTFGVDRVRALIKHLRPTGTLLRLRARDTEGHCIATGLFLGMNEASFYWGGASWRRYQNLHPNELMQWYAMRYWKKRGMKTYNLVGTMDFKARFGGRQFAVPLIGKSKYRAISGLRAKAPLIYKQMLHLTWKLKNIGRSKPKANDSEAP